MRRYILFSLILSSLLLTSCASDRPVMIVKETAHDYEKLALEHYNSGDFENAIKNFEKALEENRKVSNLPGISSDLYNLARCYINFGLYDNAQKLLEEAQEINTVSEDKSRSADCYLLLATIRIRKKEDEEALDLLEKSYSL